MQEYRRFFRYLMPSLVVIIEVFIYILITDCEQIKCFLQNSFMNSSANGNSIATLVTMIITAFLASGGFGYLLGTIYHTFFFPFNYLVDHRQLIKNIHSIDLLQLKKLCNNGEEENITIESLTNMNVWHIITSFIHERVESSERIKGAIDRLDSLADIMHGNGTTFVGSVFAFIFWAIIHYICLEKSTDMLIYIFFLIPLLIGIWHFYIFHRTAKAYQGVINIIILDEVYENFSISPLIIRISEMDLKKSWIQIIKVKIFN